MEKYRYLEHDLKKKIRTRKSWENYFRKNIKDYGNNFDMWLYDMVNKFYLLEKI